MLSSSSRRTIAAIVALVVVDLVLVVLAFGTVRSPAGPSQGAGEPATATQGPSASRSSGTASTSGGSPTRSATPSASGSGASAEPVPTTVRLVALSGDVAWRSSQGSCDAGGGALSLSRDGGRTWSTGAPPARVVLRLLPRSDQSASVVGAGDDCAATLLITSSAGSSWSVAGSTADTWYRDPKDATRVHPPGSTVVQPCEGQARVVDLAPLSTATAQALCSDGGVRTTADRGASWQRTAVAPGALALDSRRETAGLVAYVLRVDASCSGLQVARAGETTVAVGCLSGASAPGNGALALSVNGDNGWVEVGDQTWRSSDALSTWNRL